MRSVFLLIVAVTASTLAPACTTNSDGRYRDIPLDKGPLAAYRSDPTDERELEARFHLEDVVEAHVSAVYGAPVDYPTFEFSDHAYSIYWVERSAPEDFSTRTYLDEDHDDYFLLTIKFLADHVGRDLEDALDEDSARAMDQIVREYFHGDLSLDQALPSLRILEEELYGELGIDLEKVKENEETLDTSVAPLSGYTVMPYFPWFDTSQVYLPQAVFRDEPPKEIVHTYAHELMHAIIADVSGFRGSIIEIMLGTQTDERNYVEESLCQVFGDAVIARLRSEKGRSTSRPNQPDPAEEEAPSAEEAWDPWVRALERLAALYYDPSVSLDSMLVLQGRYGYVKARSKGPKDSKPQNKDGAKKKGNEDVAPELDLDLQAVLKEIVDVIGWDVAELIDDIRDYTDVIALREACLEALEQGRPFSVEDAEAFLDEL